MFTIKYKMKSIFKKLFLIYLFINCHNVSAQFNFQRSWGTYFGDERFIFSKSVVDNVGNLYIVGTIKGSDLTNLTNFTNTNSYHQNYGGGSYDGFLIKFSPQGNIIWGTFIGGESDDYVGDITIDENNNLYLIGVTFSNTNISTVGSFQENNQGNGDFFISKFNENGLVIWSTYYGGIGGEIVSNGGFNDVGRILKITYDRNNSIYIAGVSTTNNLSTTNVFQETNLNNTSNNIIAKFNSLTSSRVWCTYFGLNTNIRSIVADANAVYVSGNTVDCPPNNTYNTYYGTSNGFKPTPSNCVDLYLNKFNSLNGQRVWGTYYGGSSSELTNNKSLALIESKLYFSGLSSNSNNQNVTTSGSFQPTNNGASAFIAEFNENGTRNYATFLGNLNSTNNQPGGISNIVVDAQGDYYSFGESNMIDKATPDGFKINPNNTNSRDMFFVKFNGSTNQRIWGSYYGGVHEEFDTSLQPYKIGSSSNFYIIGNTQSLEQISTSNALQPNKMVFDLINFSPITATNIFITHFEPMPLSTINFGNSSVSIFPNPSNGNIEITFDNNNFSNSKLELFDITGKLINTVKLNNKHNTITLGNISKGIYLAKISDVENVSITKKIIIN